MERDMGTTIATKSDLQLLRQELTSLMSGLATREDMLAIKAEMRESNALIRKDMEILSSRFDNRIDMLSTAMTLRLGSMLMMGLGLLFAALKLTS